MFKGRGIGMRWFQKETELHLNIHFTFASLTTHLEFNGVIFGDICYRGGILIRPQNFL